MSNLNIASFLGATAETTPNQTTNTSNGTFKKSEFWLNIGYRKDCEKYPFVTLSQGVPVDNLVLKEVSEKTVKDNPVWADFAMDCNDLTRDIAEIANGLEPGQGKFLGGMPEFGKICVQIYRRGTTEIGKPLERKNRVKLTAE